VDVSLTVYEILTHLARKQLVFPTPPLLDAPPPSGGTPCNINVIYTPDRGASADDILDGR